MSHRQSSLLALAAGPALVWSACVGAIVLTPAGTADAQQYSTPTYRQAYSTWSYHPKQEYYYRRYYYKPAPTYSGYRHHYCVYVPSRPRYVYYYNPSRKVYWGRYDLEQKAYSLLPEKERKAKLDQIPEKAFPKPGVMPPVPDSKDGVTVERPSPKDLPDLKRPTDAPETGAIDKQAFLG